MLTEESLRRDFPSLSGRTYLNTAAEGIPPVAVKTALAQYFADKELGMDGRELHAREWDAAKAAAGELLGLSAAETTICSCASEAFNLAALALQLREGDEVVINDLDFPAGATPWLQSSCPATVKVWRSKSGALDPADLAPLLGPRTRLVSTSLVSFFNGFKLPLAPTLAVVRKLSPALFALDVTQAMGRIPLELADVDLVVASTYKWILGTHGGGIVGVPKARAEALRSPAGGWFNLADPFGSARFERAESLPGAASFTVGMPNYPAVYAARAGMEYVRDVGVKRIAAHADPLVKRCLEEVAKLPVELITPRQSEFQSGILSFKHPDFERIQRSLRAANVHVMAHAGRLRVAIHGYNRDADVETLIRELHAALA